MRIGRRDDGISFSLDYVNFVNVGRTWLGVGISCRFLLPAIIVALSLGLIGNLIVILASEWSLLNFSVDTTPLNNVREPMFVSFCRPVPVSECGRQKT